MAAAFLLMSASAASAQQAPQPTPPQPDTTTVTEPAPKPGTPQSEQPKEPVKEQEPAQVPPDASGIDLTTLETKDLDLLYFDPVQTYLTPYIARAFENSLAFHKKKFVWQPWEPHDHPAQGFQRLRQCRRARVRRTTWSCSTSRRCRCRWRPSLPASASSRSMNHELTHVGNDRRVEQPRRILAPLPRRQADADSEAP